MKIVDLKCAVIGDNPIVRIVTDEGIDGYAEVESYKPYLTWHVLHLKPGLIGEDPTNVERVMRKIRQRGAFKPWGSAVSAIEMALWDIAGKAAGLPVYKLLGGKVRDRVRTYNGAVRFPMNGLLPGRLRREHGADEGLPGEVQHHQDGDRLPQPHALGGARLLLWRAAGESLPRPPQPRPAHGEGAQARRRLRRGDEGGPRRRGRAGARLRPRLDGAGRHPTLEGGRAPARPLAGGSAHRRLHAVGRWPTSTAR